MEEKENRDSSMTMHFHRSWVTQRRHNKWYDMSIRPGHLDLIKTGLSSLILFDPGVSESFSFSGPSYQPPDSRQTQYYHNHEYD
jgi:hypothetical protein